MAYDILIKSGSVIDGVGNPITIADLGIEGEKIADIGTLAGNASAVMINASGKYVVPGFIDITNHSDTRLTIFKYPNLESMVMQGITTIIGGNCGASLAPLTRPESIDAVRKWADPSEFNINWANVAEFLAEIEKLKPAVNFGTFAGFGTLKRNVIGNEVRELGLEEKAQVKFLLTVSLEEGAFGMSLGLSYGHERASSTEELIEIARALKRSGGILKIHLRSEGKELLASVNEAVRLGRESGAPVQISHLKAIGRKSWSSLKKALELIANARASGADIGFDVSPYYTTGSSLYLLIPAGARQGGFSELFKKIDDKEERAKIIESLRSRTLHYDRILITKAKTKIIVGKTLAEIAAASNLSPEEALIETVRANEGRVDIIGRTVSAKNTELEILDKNSLIASDGFGLSQDEAKSGDLAHPRSFGAFPHFWHRFVNERKLLSPEEAVRKITFGPAERLGIEKRGVLKKGNFADITIFDPKLIRDRANYHNPFRYPSGIEWVIINGKIVVEQGRYTGIRAGKVLRSRRE